MPDFQLPAQWETWLSRVSAGTWYGIPLNRWFLAVAVFVVALLVAYCVKWILARRAAKFAERTRSEWDDAVVETLRRTKWWFLMVLAAFVGCLVLTWPERPREIVQTIAVLVLLLQLGLWGNVMIGALVARYVKRRMKDDPASVTTVSALAFVAKLVLFTLLCLLALDNLGVDVTALIAGLGVGGIAVALAVQNILGDLLASFSIVFDRPFVLGDFIIVGDKMGTVEKIGIKTTRIASLSGEQLVISNNDLLQSRVHNYRRMSERRISFSIGVTYDTPRDKLQQIPGVVQDVIESQEQVRFDRAHFKSFGDSALIFEIVYYVLLPDYNAYMDTQQAINLGIYQRFEQLGVEFAFPTRTLHVVGGGQES